MGVTDGICSAALSTLHGLLWLRGCLYWLVTCLWSTALYSLKHKGCELSSIQRDARSLSKLPLSLAVVVQEEALSYSDLAKAVTWACASGVSTITLYDPYGTLERDVERVRAAVVEQACRLFVSAPRHIEVLTSSSSRLPGNSDTACCSCSVLVLSPCDGRPRLVAAATELCQAVLGRGLAVESIQPSLLAAHITAAGSCEVPDSDLTIVFGGSACLTGYPPWSTRLTEILILPSHHKLEYQEFFSALQRYARCQKRLGK